MENENIIGFYRTNQVIKVKQRHNNLTMPIGTSIQVNEVRGDQISVKTNFYNAWVDKSFLSKLNKSS